MVAFRSRDETIRAIDRDAVAVAAAVGAFGVSFGALASGAGLSAAQTVAMSLGVFTGASQFAFIGVLAAGGGALAALAPAVLLAVRNGLYGLALAPVLGGTLGRRLVTAQLVLDESTAMARAQRSPHLARRAFLATGAAVFVCWNLGTAAGVVFGQTIGDPRSLGLDAMLPAAFLALLAPQLADRRRRAIAAGGALVALACVPFVPAGLPIVAACLAVVPAVIRSRRAGP